MTRQNGQGGHVRNVFMSGVVFGCERIYLFEFNVFILMLAQWLSAPVAVDFGIGMRFQRPL
jgi:hypothetical protein